MRFVIPADAPYTGFPESFLCKDGTVAFSGGQSLEEFIDEIGLPCRVVSEEELDALEHQAEDHITDPVEIKHERFAYMKGLMHPMRMESAGAIELFHLPERIDANVVPWFARAGNRCFEFNDEASKPFAVLAAKVNAAATL